MDRSPAEMAALRLLALPALGPRRLRALLNRHDPETVVTAIERGSVPDESSVAASLLRDFGTVWRDALRESRRSVDDRSLARSLGNDRVLLIGDADYPASLAVDAEAPGVLFARGDLSVLRSRRVAVVGTRHCTEYGRATAAGLGSALTVAGVAVVSGLARGVDAAAHRGALAAFDGCSSPGDDESLGRPVGVVASGLDVVYPREHGGLWKLVSERGLLLGEAPPGTPPERHRFPLRNRIIAALSEVVVVVESRASGGSMITVNEALSRGVPVMAVPGATSTRASDGTNLLLRDGAGVALSADDVLDALALDHHRHEPTIDPRPAPGGFDAVVLETLGRDGVAVGDLARRLFESGDPVVALAETAMALGRLEATGWVVEHGGWFERRGL